MNTPCADARVCVCVLSDTRLENYLLLRLMQGHEGPDRQQAAVCNRTQFHLKPAGGGGRRKATLGRKTDGGKLETFQCMVTCCGGGR